MTTECGKERREPTERTATVSRWLPFSCVDGPGNRLVLFLQGCNFRCPDAHRGQGALAGGALHRLRSLHRRLPAPCQPQDQPDIGCRGAGPAAPLRSSAHRHYRLRRRGHDSAAVRDRPVHGHQAGTGSLAPDLSARQQRLPGRDGLAAAAAGTGRRHDRSQGVARLGAPFTHRCWPRCACWRVMASWPSCGCSTCRDAAIFWMPMASWKRVWPAFCRTWGQCPSASTAFVSMVCAEWRRAGRRRAEMS